MFLSKYGKVSSFVSEVCETAIGFHEEFQRINEHCGEKETCENM